MLIDARRHPVLRTRRLLLRGLRDEDATTVTAMIGDKRVSRWLLSFPYPYPPGAAANWIARTHDSWLDGTGATFAITTHGTVMGAIGLRLVARHDHAEIGYWLGAPYWGNGFAAEAAKKVI